MAARLALACFLGLGVFGGHAAAQQQPARVNHFVTSGRDFLYAKILDVIFPLEVPHRPFHLKMALRFPDSTQVVVVMYPEPQFSSRRCDVISYSLDGITPDQLDGLIQRMEVANPKVTAQEVARTLKVTVKTVAILPEALDSALEELKSIRISPALTDRVVLHAPMYGFWYDTWQDVVHYSFVASPASNDPDPEDRLARWMEKFRENLPALLKTGMPKPSGPTQDIK